MLAHSHTYEVCSGIAAESTKEYKPYEELTVCKIPCKVYMGYKESNVKETEECNKNFFDIRFGMENNKVHKHTQQEKGNKNIENVAAENNLLHKNKVYRRKGVAYYVLGPVFAGKSPVKLVLTYKGQYGYSYFKGKTALNY